MEYQYVEIAVKNHIATLSLTRMEKLNALNRAFAVEITTAVQELQALDDVRVIILASKARAFCAGMDLADFQSLRLFNGGAKSSLFWHDKTQSLLDCCNILEKCRKPVVAAVHGICVGGGVDMIAACDIRLCTADASFSLKETAIGLVADMGVLQRLPHIIGQGFTREMAYTARFYSANEVERMGLVSTVYPDRNILLAEAQKLAAQIAVNAPLAVMATKEVLNYSRLASIEDGMTCALQRNAVLISSRDVQEASLAFRQKRKPNFEGE